MRPTVEQIEQSPTHHGDYDSSRGNGASYVKVNNMPLIEDGNHYWCIKTSSQGKGKRTARMSSRVFANVTNVVTAIPAPRIAFYAVGDIVKCIDVSTADSGDMQLTLGKEYKVTDLTDRHLRIRDDSGYRWWKRTRFLLVLASLYASAGDTNSPDITLEKSSAPDEWANSHPVAESCKDLAQYRYIPETF